MARVTIEDCLEHVNNRFLLVQGAIMRVTQLKKGVDPLVNAPGEKETVVALREIGQGKVSVTHKDSSDLPPEVH